MADRVLESFEFQAHACSFSSPLYASVLATVVDDLRAGGITRSILEPHAGDPFGSALALRFLGAVHRIVLDGGAPALARHYPSAGGTPGDTLGEDFLATVEAHHDAIAEGTTRPVQTNEVGRAASLVGGHCLVAHRTGMPLRCLEVGASAGLLLLWDRFCYVTPAGKLGDPDASVVLDGPWDRPPPLNPVEVVERRGCDLRPVDPTSEHGRLLLRGFLWPDEVERRTRLDAALELAAATPVAVDQAEAVGWLREQLAEPRPGVATVVQHSIVLQYLPSSARRELAETVTRAGAAAAADAPVAWLRMEPDGEVASIRLTIWPGGDEREIATSGFHGQHVRWSATETGGQLV